MSLIDLLYLMAISAGACVVLGIMAYYDKTGD